MLIDEVYKFVNGFSSGLGQIFFFFIFYTRQNEDMWKKIALRSSQVTDGDYL